MSSNIQINANWSWKLCRCFLSAGLPVSSPQKSRLVKALCVLLCEKHTQGRKTRDGRQMSCWRLVLSEYSAIRAQLMNSQALLEGSSLALYAINQTTLVSKHAHILNIVSTCITDMNYCRQSGIRIVWDEMKSRCCYRASLFPSQLHVHVPVHVSHFLPLSSYPPLHHQLQYSYMSTLSLRI